MSGARLVVDGLRVGGHDLSFVADGGTSVALLGTPGDDSSMLLETVAGLRPSRDGVVLLGGGPVGPPRVGIMQRPTGLFQELTAAENVAVPLLAQHRPEDPDLIDRTLASLDLAPASRHNLVEQLSGGQQQRVAIARALVSSAPLLCLDEPVSELDEASIETVWTALTAALSAGAILVIATVDAELAARCDQLVPLGTSTGPAA